MIEALAIEQTTNQKLVEWEFHFVVCNLVFEVALFCPSNVQMITIAFVVVSKNKGTS